MKPNAYDGVVSCAFFISIILFIFLLIVLLIYLFFIISIILFFYFVLNYFFLDAMKPNAYDGVVSCAFFLFSFRL